MTVSKIAKTRINSGPRPIDFGTKAETLLRLAPRMVGARVLPQVCFTVAQWRQTPLELARLVLGQPWGNDALIVRSSAADEDTASMSMAGAYESVADVRGLTALRSAVERVIASYDSSDTSHQILVQPMVRDVRLGGVAFSVEPNTGRPYIVISHAEGTVAGVTSGGHNVNTHYFLRHSATHETHFLSRVVDLIHELESLTGCCSLDIEFAIDSREQLFLLQARPLANVERQELSTSVHTEALGRAHDFIGRLDAPHPHLLGAKTCFAVMSDWNPAEMIGRRPRPLARSLYRTLITDWVWADQRRRYGYRDLYGFPLMVTFCGLPYIDVRASFNSFVPADVDLELGHRLVDFYVDRLIRAPHLHDKVEFQIVYSCYTLDLRDRLRELLEHGFSTVECESLSASLLRLTNRIVHPRNGIWHDDLDHLQKLDTLRQAVLGSSLGPIGKIHRLLEDCKRYGTLPFAGLARAAFVATEMLRSLRAIGLLSAEDCDRFYGSLSTVCSNMLQDRRELDRASFLAKYGHLRPGTYDILSPRYDEAFELYFHGGEVAGGEAVGATDGVEPISPPPRVIAEIDGLLAEHRLAVDAKALLAFMRAAVEARERAKFSFTRSVSDLLNQIGELAAQYGLDREDASFLSISDVESLFRSSADVGAVLHQSAARGREAYAVTKQVILPPVVLDADDVWSFAVPASEPNFVTTKRARGRVVVDAATQADLDGCIVFIDAADPGYDWLFCRNIAGLVTAYGGANSHMGVRAAELGVPAVIGAGEELFAKWGAARYVELDCLGQRVQIIR